LEEGTIYLSVFTDELGLDIGEALPIIKSWGVQHVDLRGRVLGSHFENLQPDQLHELPRMLDDHGLTVGCLEPSLCKVYLPERERPAPCAAWSSQRREFLHDRGLRARCRHKAMR